MRKMKLISDRGYKNLNWKEPYTDGNKNPEIFPRRSAGRKYDEGSGESSCNAAHTLKAAEVPGSLRMRACF